MMFQDAAGTIPALLPGDPVGRVTRLAGNVDAAQAVAMSRPTLACWPKGGRRNLVTRTAALSHADWLKNQCSVAGTLITSNAASSFPQIRQAAIPITSGQTITVSVEAWVEPGNANQTITIIPTSIPGGGSTPRTSVNLVTGAVTSANGGIGSSVLLPSGHRRVQWQWTATGSGTLQVNFYVGTFTPQPAGVAVNLAGPQIETGAVQTPYQTVGSANDVTEPGVSDVWHLWDDGGDSLPAGPLPAGEYGLAWVDALGTVTVTTIVSDGATPIDVLRAERQTDAILRSEPFSAAEIAQIHSYWARYAA